MLSKEEIEKAKEMLNKLKDYKVLVGGCFVEILTEEENDAIETLLQYIDQLEQEIQLSNFVHECDINKINQLNQENKDTYWKGYIQKQNEAVEICKMCKYRKQYFERNVKEHE